MKQLVALSQLVGLRGNSRQAEKRSAREGPFTGRPRMAFSVRRPISTRLRNSRIGSCTCRARGKLAIVADHAIRQRGIRKNKFEKLSRGQRARERYVACPSSIAWWFSKSMAREHATRIQWRPPMDV